jgi:tetratricopeptide (TPR) repeat protein
MSRHFALTPQNARKASLYALALILGGLLTVGVYNLSGILGPRRMEVGEVPFGLPAGTRIPIGKSEKESFKGIPQPIIQEVSRAQELLRVGNWKVAAEIFKGVSLQYPDLKPALLGQALALVAQSPLSDANRSQIDAILLQLDRKYPGDASTQYLRGLVASRQGQATVALEFLEQAVRESPGSLDPHLELGRVLLEGGQPLGAQSEARTGISLSQGSDGRFYSLLARAYHDNGSLDSCGQVVEYGLTRFPGEMDLIVINGMLLEYKGLFDQAEMDYHKVQAIDPENLAAKIALRTLGEKSPPGSQNSKGMVTPREKAQLAIDILEPLVRQYPENIPLRDALGQAYLKGRSFDLARLQFEEIQDRDEEYPDIQLRIQEAKAVNRDPREAVVLSQELKRATDSLRTTQGKDRSFSERLGHYLVRWGAPPKEFFAKYPIAGFKQLDSQTWQELSWEPPFEHKTTVEFTKEHGLSAVHVLVRDTSFHVGMRNTVFDLFGRLLAQNSRISGIGTATGEAECDSMAFQGVVWENTDNFEMMLQFSSKRSEVRILRLNKDLYETMPRLCGHMPRLLKY